MKLVISVVALSLVLVSSGYSQDTVQVNAGWNIIGTVDHPVPAPSGGIVTSPVYGYNGSGYVIVSSLVPGQGYWVKTNSSGSLPLGSQAYPRVAADQVESFTRITIADRLGRKQSLYLAEESAHAELYGMPPMPPAKAKPASAAT